MLDPALERGTLAGSSYHGERLFISASGVTAFWQRHHLGSDTDLAGVELSLAIPPMPLVKTPALELTTGVARVRNDGKTRAWLAMRWKP